MDVHFQLPQLPARFKRFLSYYQPHLGLACAVLACAALSSGFGLLFPLIARNLVRDLSAGMPLSLVFQAGAVLLALVAAQTACAYFTDFQGHAMGAKMESDMRSELFAHYQKLSHRFYDNQRTGELMTRLTSDLLNLAELYHHGPEDLLMAAVRFFGAFAILLSIDARLTLAVFALLPVAGVLVYVTSRRMNRALRQGRDRIGGVNAQVEDSLGGIRAVKSFAAEAAEQEKFERENRRFLDSRIDGYRQEARLYNGMTGFSLLITAAVVVLGGAALAGGRLDAADLLAFLMYVESLMDPLNRLANFVRLCQEGFTGFDRFMEMMEVEPDLVDAPGAARLADVRGGIELRHVTFRYRPGSRDILRDVNVSIRAGEYVALVGPSGAGKTTLCSLLPRFYDVSEGQVLLDGKDVRDIRLDSLRRQIGVVQQEVYLFAGSVLENICYGRPGASREEAVEAAKKAGAHDFILGLPDGYDTDVGQRGVRLSGGQRQRLCIARVFLKDPPVLLFDEATSSLDNESERAVQESLETLAKGRTTLVIAHRLSTIRRADRILVLDGLGIAESGTHEELLRREGIYARLYRMQWEI